MVSKRGGEGGGRRRGGVMSCFLCVDIKFPQNKKIFNQSEFSNAYYYHNALLLCLD